MFHYGNFHVHELHELKQHTDYISTNVRYVNNAN